MRKRPILFSAPMVRAILAGTKTQTRRVVRIPEMVEEPGDYNATQIAWLAPEDGEPGWHAWMTEYPEEGCIPIACPYGQPGDRLWVRETYFAWGRWETRFSAKKGRDEWHFIDMTLEAGHQYSYPADGRFIAPHRRTGGVNPTFWKRPAIFMPRAASRITLEVTGVRVDRLQDISEADARAEGASFRRISTGDARIGLSDWWSFGTNRAGDDIGGGFTARQGYELLWEQINGPESWAANPWVWVIEFRRLEAAC